MNSNIIPILLALGIIGKEEGEEDESTGNL